MSRRLEIYQLGQQDYKSVWQAMSAYTDRRDDNSPDQLWLVQHPPVFTQGQAGKAEHILMPGDIPVVQVDRGGQVTYHGPGQIVAYPLINLRRLGIGVRDLVTALEQAIVATLADFKVEAYPKPDAPGVYVNETKVASLGLRVRRGCSFHGLSLNVDMDLQPFDRINPCGYVGLQMSQLSQLTDMQAPLAEVEQRLCFHLATLLDYNEVQDLDQLPDILQAELADS